MKARLLPCARLYPAGLPAAMAGASSVLLAPGVWAMDGTLSAVILTTPERQNWTIWSRLWTCLKVGILLGIFLVCTPASIFGAILRMLSGPFRRPFLYQTASNPSSQRTNNHKGPTDFTVATANVCLLPESFSRINNLSNTKWRTAEVGRRVVTSQKEAGHLNDGHSDSSMNSQSDKRTVDQSGHTSSEEFLSSIDSTFPTNVDVFCFQELFYSDTARWLTEELLKCYDHVISDVGICSFTNRWALNSGLLLASKHPILAAEFRPFKVKAKTDVICAKGVLMVKLHLGTRDGQDVVGYVATTHLQAYQGKQPIQKAQLTLMQTWIQEFLLATKAGNETVAVDVVCGDFNFDNMSPGYKTSWTHPFMDIYTDVCSLHPGRDKPWTIVLQTLKLHNWRKHGRIVMTFGTEMRQVVLYDESISSPERTAATLRQRHLQGRYLLDATVKNPTMGMVWEEEDGVRQGDEDVPETSGRARVDKVLYRTDTLSTGCTVTPVRYRSVTQFAGLTDHVSVCLTFRLGRT